MRQHDRSCLIASRTLIHGPGSPSRSTWSRARPRPVRSCPVLPALRPRCRRRPCSSRWRGGRAARLPVAAGRSHAQPAGGGPAGPRAAAVALARRRLARAVPAGALAPVSAAGAGGAGLGRTLATAGRDGPLRAFVRIFGRRSRAAVARRGRADAGRADATAAHRGVAAAARPRATVVAARAVHGRPAGTSRSRRPAIRRTGQVGRRAARRTPTGCPASADRRRTHPCGLAARSDPMEPPSRRATDRACLRDRRRAAATACPTRAPAGRDCRAATSRRSPGPTLQLTQAGAHCRPGIQYQRPPLFTPQRP